MNFAKPVNDFDSNKKEKNNNNNDNDKNKNAVIIENKIINIVSRDVYNNSDIVLKTARKNVEKRKIKDKNIEDFYYYDRGFYFRIIYI